MQTFSLTRWMWGPHLAGIDQPASGVSSPPQRTPPPVHQPGVAAGVAAPIALFVSWSRAIGGAGEGVLLRLLLR